MKNNQKGYDEHRKQQLRDGWKKWYSNPDNQEKKKQYLREYRARKKAEKLASEANLNNK